MRLANLYINYLSQEGNLFVTGYDDQSSGHNFKTNCSFIHTRSVNKVMRLPAYRTIWQYFGLALHMKVR